MIKRSIRSKGAVDAQLMLIVGVLVLGLVFGLGWWAWSSWSASRASANAIWWASSHNFKIEVEIGGEIRHFESIGIPHTYENSNGWFFKDKADGKATIVDKGFVAKEK